MVWSKDRKIKYNSKVQVDGNYLISIHPCGGGIMYRINNASTTTVKLQYNNNIVLYFDVKLMSKVIMSYRLLNWVIPILQ